MRERTCGQALPEHEGGNTHVNNDRDDAHHVIDVAGVFQMLNELRANFRATDRADGHDQAEAQIDIAHRAMTFRGHDRFSDDMREIGADGEIPVQPDSAQGRTGDETAADAEKPAKYADHKSDDSEIDWADLRVGDRKHHRDHSERPPCSRRINAVVTVSSRMACPIIKTIATTA